MTWCPLFNTSLPFERCIFLTKLTTFLGWNSVPSSSVAELFTEPPTSCSSCLGAGLVLCGFSPRAVLRAQTPLCSGLGALYLQLWATPLHEMTQKQPCCCLCPFLLAKPYVLGSFAHLFGGCRDAFPTVQSCAQPSL